MKLLNKKDVGQRRVYDIEVEDVHNFYANGVNVHNCATDGGVSVIKDDGAVVDLTYSISSNEAGKVWFAADGGIEWTSRIEEGGYVYIYRENTIPVADKTSQPDARYGNFEYTPSISDLVFVGNTSFDAVEGAVGSDEGLTHLAENPETPTEGMVDYTTSTYNTGWMNGDIKLAALSDTDDTDLVGGDLQLVVPNSDFSSWTSDDPDNWAISNEDASNFITEAVSGARIVSDNTATVVMQLVSFLEVGKQYAAKFVKSSHVSGEIRAATPGNLFNIPNSDANGTFWAVFEATDGNFQIYRDNSGPTDYVLESVEVYEVDHDRSVNAKGLIVNGTVTREPVAPGADLVAYSGFSTSNYLEQPYNPDLDFGTGDFCVMGWVKIDGLGSFRSIVDSRDPSAIEGFFLGGISPGVATFGTRAASVSSGVSGSISIDNNIFHHVCGVCSEDGANLKLYVDGVLDASATVTARSIGGTDTPIYIGQSRLLTSENWTGSLALLRISGTAPTDEQIKRIYEDEKFLFQENAQATLYGTSDAVAALAHDPVTDLLHVGTSDGRSVFQGLRRVENTTDAVSTAISASNDLIVED
jgi:hypothetical protein